MELVIDRGVKSYDVKDADGTLLGVIKINPADIGISGRFVSARNAIAELAEQAKQDMTPEKILAMDTTIKAELNKVEVFKAMRERWGDDTLAADVLVAGHHGSLTSSGQDFLAAVRPVQVVVSAGYRNRFRHPHPTVWARYADWGAQRWRTDRDGAVQIVLGHAAGPQLSGYRAGHPHWWRSRWP